MALNQDNVNDAFVLGGLWNTRDRPPVDVPGEALFKRVYKTGLPEDPLSHTVEFDDVKQSITITTSTEQKITLDPTKIELSTTGGLVSITLDVLTESVLIEGTKISMSAAEISLSAFKVSINGVEQTDIKGGVVTIN